MSNDDLDNLPPSGGNPLDGDLGNLPPIGNNPLEGEMGNLPPIGSNPLESESLEEMGPPIGTPPPADDIAQESPPSGDEEATSAVTVEEPVEKGPGFLARLAEWDPYTVILAASLLALLIGILCLLLEWGSYGFDTKAKGAGQSARMSAPFDSAVAAADRGLAV